MNIYQNRLNTFRSNQGHWPHSKYNNLKIENFAKAGFFSCKKKKKTSDNVKCFLCDIELNNWTSKQTPFVRHASESPSCPYVLLDYPDSRILTAGAGTTSPKGPLMKAARMATFSTEDYWPPKKIGNVKKSRLQPVSVMVEAGFYYSPTLENPLRIRCPYCHFSIIQPDLDINILNDHKQTKEQCPFFKSTTGMRSKLKNKPTQSEPMKKKRRISQSSSEEGSQKTEQINFDNSIWDINNALAASKKERTSKVLKTFSKKKNKSKKSDDYSPLLAWPPTLDVPQENMLDDEVFNQFNIESSVPDSSKSQKGKEKEGYSQQQIAKSKSRISITHIEDPQQITRPDKAPQRVTVMSSPNSETQERTVPISLFRQGRTSKKLSMESFSSKRDSLPRERQSSSSHSSSKKDSLPNERPVTPPPPSDSFLSKRSLLMQSTPNQSSIPLSTFNIFGEGVFSPIVGNEPIRDLGGLGKNEPYTPLPFSSRTYELINENNQLNKLKRRPRSPTQSDSDMTQTKAMENTVETVTQMLYQDELTEEERNMTVADYIKSSIEKEIQKICDYGEERIKEIRECSEKLKQDIIDS
ncbi:hypothetical protein K501DRAFT_327861 [Backusella circina FSU 941]|nr:hypothetical protein K501DRAFT_327861 [Backusella circina FSU 941]